MKASLIACLFVFSLDLSSQSIASWELDEPLLQAYQHSIKFELTESGELLEAYKGQSIYGKMYLQHLNEAISVFIHEEDLQFREFDAHSDERINQLKAADESPYRLYYLSEIKLHKTFINLKFGEEFSAAWNFRQAFMWAEKNREKYPEFDLSLKNIGLMHVIVGSTPEKYKWLLNIFGFRGSLQQGIGELQRFSAINEHYAIESDIMMAFVYSYLLQNSDRGLEVLNKYEEEINNHLLLTYSIVSILIKSSQSEIALKRLESFNNKSESFPFFNYLKGNILQQKGLYNASNKSFERFLSEYGGHNYLKDTYFKIGLNHWLMEDMVNANENFEKSKSTGQRITEADKNASFVLKEGVLPDRNIMRLRLLTDGGYVDKASEVVDEINRRGLDSHKDSVEFIYRQARLFHKTGRTREAKNFYLKTIEHSGSEHWYFAPNSALQLGYIYRDEGLIDESRDSFEKALGYNNHPYKNSIDNKAEAALANLVQNQ